MQNIKIIPRQEKFRPYEKILLPSDRCQVCLSKTDFQESNQIDLDKLVKCQMCLSTIHQKHYGGELQHSIPQHWKCQRCQYLLNNPSSEIMKCQFCLDIKGVMKIVQHDKRKVWSHPECVIWDYPAKVFTCQKMIQVQKLSPSKTSFQKFWCPQYTNISCANCESSYGDFVKCRYYTCSNHYHVPCARQLGVIRELQQMRVFNNGNYTYIPVLCPEHLQKRVTDFKSKANKANDKQSTKYLSNMVKIYQKQYSELIKSSKEEMKQIHYQLTYEQNKQYQTEQRMEVEEYNEPSQATPIGEQSLVSESFINFLQEQMKNVYSQTQNRLR